MMTARTWIGLATESAGVLGDDWPGRGWAWRQSQRESSVMTGRTWMGLAGARACEGGWLSGSVITEDIRGIQDRVPERGVEPLCPCGQTGLSRPRIPFRHPGLGAANRNMAWLECAP